MGTGCCSGLQGWETKQCPDWIHSGKLYSQLRYELASRRTNSATDMLTKLTGALLIALIAFLVTRHDKSRKSIDQSDHSRDQFGSILRATDGLARNSHVAAENSQNR